MKNQVRAKYIWFHKIWIYSVWRHFGSRGWFLRCRKAKASVSWISFCAVAMDYVADIQIVINNISVGVLSLSSQLAIN